jgi:calcium permeable stress-gated cation channel
MKDNPIVSGAAVQKFVNLDGRSYLKFLNWMPAALKMPQDELISHAGLDSVVYLRIYLTGYVYAAYSLTLCLCNYIFSVVTQ